MQNSTLFYLSEDWILQIEQLLNINAANCTVQLGTTEYHMAGCPCGNTCSGDPTNNCQACQGFLTVG